MQNLHKALLTEVQPISFDLDSRTESLTLIADWSNELRDMLAAALNPLDCAPDLDWLKVEVERFKLGCKGVRA
jgi:hypothetical protein